MNRNTDIIFMTEYIENVLYFAVIREGIVPQNSDNAHYFCIDHELIYENYYLDFGPLNLGCVYKYCLKLKDKIKMHLHKNVIIHYTSTDPRKKANAAYLMGCYGVLYLALPPGQAYKPFVVSGQCYKPFQDATPTKSGYTITILECLQALAKARDLGLFNFEDFNVEEYIRLDKIQGGDLNWIVPGKFLAFIGPVDHCYTLHHPPEMYIDYFLENNVEVVIRLNKKLYDCNVFLNYGIAHHDLYFPDGTCPRRHIVIQFLEISEETSGAIAVHCKAGLGRTGSLIGCYLIKHYRMTAHEAIAWMRICRPGSVIGHQQEWLEQLEAWLIKQGNLYRKRMYQNVNKFPKHDYGIYSIAKKSRIQPPIVLSKSPSPPPPIRRQSIPASSQQRPQAPKPRDDVYKTTGDKFELHLRKIPLYQSIVNNKIPYYSSKSNKESPHVIYNNNSEQRPSRNPSRSRANTPKPMVRPSAANEAINKIKFGTHVPTSNVSPSGMISKNLSDVKHYLQNRRQNMNKESELESLIKVSPQYSFYVPTLPNSLESKSFYPPASKVFEKGQAQTQVRRRLGRSPSPAVPIRKVCEVNRATNTMVGQCSKSPRFGMEETLATLKLTGQRNGSVGAASLGARKDAPVEKRAISIRSDERPIATQGDLLNSIKYQRGLKESLAVETKPTIKNSYTLNTSSKTVASKTSCNAPKPKAFRESSKEKFIPTSKGFLRPYRSSSPQASPASSFYLK